ncbi:MAG: exosortase/archaeosortase family protein, partial [Verrucomicrobiota bacterium]|nr:exosortase/archaeosortase family protein [Verrucomicrobiota bacterium]
LKRLTIKRRVLLVGAALTIALLANFGRAVFLVWIAAAQDLAAVERWHDIAGYAIVGLVFLGTIVTASAFTKVESVGKAEIPPNNQEPITDNRSHKRPVIFLLGKPGRAFTCFVTATLAFLLCAEGAVSFWYRWHERNFVPTASWEVRWPEEARDFRELPIAENIRSTLRYDAGREATWRLRLLPNEVDAPSQCTMFFFRWEAGSTSILRARAHRPDICLPNTGWRLTEDLGVREYPAADGLSLPFRHFRFVRDAGAGLPVFADAFFCQREDRVPSVRADRFDATSGGTGHWEIADRLRVVREGLRNQGQQVLELVFISRQPLTSEQVESEFAGLVPRVVKAKAPGH